MSRWLALLLLSGLAAGVAADDGPPLRWSSQDARLDALEVLRDPAAFSDPGADALALEPRHGQRVWLQLAPEPDPDARRLLVLDRVPLRALEVFAAGPGASPPILQDGFFAPAPGEALRSGFVIPQSDSRPLLIALDPQLPARMGWRLRSEREALVEARALSNLAAAAYATVFATALFSLALTLAVRESAYRDFTLFAAAFGALLALAQGHAFELPLVGPLLGLVGSGLLLAAGLLAAAGALLAAHGLLGLASSGQPLDRASAWVARGLLLLAGLMPLLPAALHAELVPAWAAVLLLALSWPVIASARTAARGARPAIAQCLLWLLAWLALAALVGVLAGWWAGSDTLRWLQQAGGSLAALGLLVALTDRVIALRQRAEGLQALHAASSAVLRVEQKRRELDEALDAAIEGAAEPSDLEWRAFRLLLQALPDLLPLRAVALSVTGFRGFDYLLAEPMQEKPRICALLVERSSTLRGICRARTPISLPPEGRGELAEVRFAVVPLPVPRPGWGALLLEREAGAAFSGEELELAAEFAALTFRGIEQGLRSAELRRRAELDALTGLPNQRAGEAQLEMLIDRARHERRPLALLCADVDLLRTANQRFGMAVGDQFLRGLGDLVRTQLDPDDLLFRCAEDEFVVALPGRDIERASDVAERIRAAVAAQRLDSAQGPVKLTLSLGVAALQAGDDSPRRLIERARRGAGLAKGEGRNRVARARAFGSAAEAPERPPLF